jgi:hypothetical protein
MYIEFQPATQPNVNCIATHKLLLLQVVPVTGNKILLANILLQSQDFGWVITKKFIDFVTQIVLILSSSKHVRIFRSIKSENVVVQKWIAVDKYTTI